MKILLIAHSFPPLNAISTYRALHWCQCWVEAGHSVSVLTTRKYGFEGYLDLDEDSSRFDVHEIDYLPRAASRFLTPRARISSVASKRARGPFRRIALKWLRYFGGRILEPTRFWVGPGARRAVQLLGQGGFDAVVSTFGPPAAHLIAARVVRSSPDIVWIADYRDRWSGNQVTRAFPLTQLLERKIEERALFFATGIVQVSKDNAEHFFNTHGRVSEVIHNGFQPSEYRNLPGDFIPPEFSDARLNLVHAGKLYEQRRNPLPLINAIRECPDGSRPMLHFYGDQPGNLVEHVAKSGLEHDVQFHGYKGRRQILKTMKAADALVFLESGDPDSRGVVTGKIFEYLALRKPILALGIKRGFESAELIEACGVGLVSEDCPTAISEFLRAPKKYFRPNESELKKYQRDSQAEAIVQMIIHAAAGGN